MKPSIYIALLFSIVLTTAKAQQLRLAVAPEFNFPTGNAVNRSAIGFGGALKAEIGIADGYAITGNVGYNIFLTKRIFGNKLANLTAVPVKLGFKYYPSPDFYLEGQAGTAFKTGSSSKNSFAWSPGFGTFIKTGNSTAKLDFGLRYEAWTNAAYNSAANLKTTSFGFIGLKVGYVFGL